MSDPVNSSPADVTAGHIPASLCYGPVSSRRFGRSLGVSFSDPGKEVQCRWRCPYCQLGRVRPTTLQHAPAERIIEAVTERLSHLTPGSIDAVTYAGNGEPLDHPKFHDIVKAIAPLAAAHGAETVLLTNGDGCDDPLNRAGLQVVNRYYIKWDPGARGGAWKWQTHQQSLDRLDRLRSLPALRVQAMLFDDSHGGNAGERHRRLWLRDVAHLSPIEVQLTTIERDPADQRRRPVSLDVLAVWKNDAARLLGKSISVFGTRRKAEDLCAP